MQEVVFYHSGMAGMPAGNTNVAGGVIAVLDACLVNGLNSISVTSLLHSAGVATATTASTHNFSIGDWIEIAGATPAAYNDRFKVTGKTSNTFTFAIDSGTASPASGTMSAKHPAAGWTKSVAGTNIAGYRGATAGGGMGHHVQVEDNNPYADSHVSFRARMAVNLTALDTATELTEQCQISKLSGSTYWSLFADGKTCYLIFGGQQTFCFGETAPLNPTDTYAWFMSKGATATGISYFGESAGSHFPCVGAPSNLSITAASFGAKLLRSYAQIAGDVPAAPSNLSFALNGADGTTGAGSMYAAQRPFNAINASDAAVGTVPIFMCELTGASVANGNLTIRSRLRGVLQPLGLLPAAAIGAQGVARLEDTTIGGTLRSMGVSRIGDATNRAQIAFDLGPAWS